MLIGFPLVALAVHHLGSPNLWFDESAQCWLSLGLHHYTAPFAPSGGLADIVRHGRTMNTDPGVFTILFRFWMTVFGFAPVAVRAFPYLFFSLIPAIIVASLLRHRVSPLCAALAGSIPLGFPMLLNYATEVRAYSMEACAVAFFFFLPCWINSECRPWKVVAIGCAAGLLAGSRYSAFLFGAAACATALLAFQNGRRTLARAVQFGAPMAIVAIASYLLFARYQVNGSHQAPTYVEPLLLHGKSAEARLALLRGNFLTWTTAPITALLIIAPLFAWFGPRTLAAFRVLSGRIAVFCALSIALTAAASLAGLLPWAVETRWSIGYQALSACSLALLIALGGVWLQTIAGRRFVPAAAAIILCVAWGWQLKRAAAVERPYYETTASHLYALSADPAAKDIRFFVQPNATPTVRYLCELGPLKDKFSYPDRFHFETEQEVNAAGPISPDRYDVVVMSHFTFADSYRARVGSGNGILRASPQPSCLLMLRKSPL
jgi:hypothetical protein